MLRAKLKNIIKNRDGNKCRNCGNKRNKNKPHKIHYIDYDKNNICDNNLILLCNRCYSKVNKYDLGYWQLYMFFNIHEKDSIVKITWEDACNFTSESFDSIKLKDPEIG